MPTTPSNPLFLGLDLSTQGLKAVLVDEEGSVVSEHAVNFDKDLPHFGTVSGAVRGPDEGEVTSPVRMWLEAIDLVMDRMKADGVDFSSIVAISGDGQQHGSVYWSPSAPALLSSLDAAQPLAPQLCPQFDAAAPSPLPKELNRVSAFSLLRSPIWQDSSNTNECRALEAAVGGKQALADLTGSRAYERFTGPQIMRIRRVYPEAYANTIRISLVSSFIPSLFLQDFAPIEVSDASGMNLTNILTNKWDDNLLAIVASHPHPPSSAAAEDLRSKLGPDPVTGASPLGTIGAWWVRRYGFSPDTLIAPFMGDNPATLLTLSQPSDGILSLGTSTTFLLSIPPSPSPPARFTTSHILAHPALPGGHIAMLCYKNGALERDRIARGDWARFGAMVAEERERRERRREDTEDWLGFYFGLREIIPPGVQGAFFFRLPILSYPSPPSPPNPITYGAPQRVRAAAFPDALHPLAILRTQLLSILARIPQILPAAAPPLRRLVLTGGGSASPVIRQMAADVFGMEVYVPDGSREAAAVGGAWLAKWAWWRKQQGVGEGLGGRGTFEEMTASLRENVKRVAVPVGDERVRGFYEGMVGVYRTCEEMVVRECEEREGGPLA
ncbi:actin-like ATPase domain-containing protein [Gloeophyllum trabeum ATCC 11539]|uniref:Xylulose kinase n=1 Tax=Gloeophyllum trabeum (strain ATCC 11539 / FP-39264 / Madison 617) TaxID=670483 RepID=S7QB28_GLOTA|nr:actin-like ATPase domain-containing protein [Gloeophyllum trabeum ATCC 11539]EPQ56533.1 actin-like ATPase domain-containing protein [Gloeophyllum trabeum ATCC 11539]